VSAGKGFLTIYRYRAASVWHRSAMLERIGATINGIASPSRTGAALQLVVYY